jgi:transcription antitermination factor NusG
MSATALWFAAYVRSRHEARVALHFGNRDVEYFLPTYKSERRWSDRKRELQLPLFPGYIFVRIERNDRGRVLETPGVIMLVGASGHPEAIEDAEIERLRVGVRCDARPDVNVKVGELVEVTSGPLVGTRGIVVRGKNSCRVVVRVESVRRSMSVEVDASAVKPVVAI